MIIFIKIKNKTFENMIKIILEFHNIDGIQKCHDGIKWRYFVTNPCGAQF